MTTSTQSWESLRRQARHIEQEIDNKLIVYSKVSSSQSDTALERELEDCLKRLTLIVNDMALVVDNGSSNNMLHILQRHRDILFDHNKEFKKLRSTIKSMQNRTDLMLTINDGGSSVNGSKGPTPMEEYLLTERGKIDNSHQMADEVMMQAYETQEALRRQRGMLKNSSSRMTAIANKIPLVNSLLTKISTRKGRDTFVLGCVISICFCLLIYFSS